MPTLSEKLKKTAVVAPHLIVEARAGTGKTTTLVEGLKRVKGIESKLTPSPQQAAVWESMMLSKDARTVCFVAFNKSIATELQARVPSGCQAMTMHSMGLKAVTANFGKVKVNQYRVQDIIAELTGRDIRELRRFKPEFVKGVEDLVGLCKMNLVGMAYLGADNAAPVADAEFWEDELDKLASHYSIELNGSRHEVFELVPKVLKRCTDVAKDSQIDFDDMIWIPVVLNLPVFTYDLLLVDEAQDLNRCQQALARAAGRRLILCGDPRQAIYGFAGADAESMPRMFDELSDTPEGCLTLPLTVTRRCGKAIVVEANKIVADFSAFESNGPGKVSQHDFNVDESKSYRQIAAAGDMVLCRVNAPLVSQCFKFLKAGRKATIQGRDIGQGLISTVEKLKANDVADLMGKLSDWRHSETAKENAKRNPNETRLMAIEDRYECLAAFAEDQTTVEAVIARINAVFTDEKAGTGIKLSSVHKAKGLESRRVFILLPKGASMPHPLAKTPWQVEQEMNLKYVAITRAIEELVYVS